MEVFADGGCAVEIFPGIMAEFQKASILRRDLRHLHQARREAIDLTLEYGRLNVVELLVGGWDDDPRGLYEVPEVRRWIKLAHERWPDLLFWLPPDSLRTCLLCLNPDLFGRLPDGRIRIAFDPERLGREASVSAVAAMDILRDAGMPKRKVELCAGQAQDSLLGMLEQKHLGDYAVVHPREHAVITYRE